MSAISTLTGLSVRSVIASIGDTYPRYVTSDDIWYRKDLRNGKYIIDYSEDGGVTWTLELISFEPDEDTIIINIDSGVAGYRELVRNGIYVIDHELNDTGFDGVENVDWENIISIAG